MASLTNTNDVYLPKEPTHGLQSCNIGRIWIFSEYFEVRESLHTRVVSWVNMSILNHNNTKESLSKYEDNCMIYRPEW